ncbi:MAG: hypothetical protein K8R53_05570 [Bacteroidales bacterium]|nr:hypothetical protein [Bacteroidales bacterium]
MGIEAISELIAVVLAISLATERMVLMIRTPQKLLWIIPLGLWLNEENKEYPKKDGPRQLMLQLISFLCAIFTVGWFAVDGWNPLGSISIASQTMPLWLIAILATGGSSFWKNLLGYTKAIRDEKKKNAL